MAAAISQPQTTIDLTSYLAIDDVQDLSQICRLCGIVPPKPVLQLLGKESRKKDILKKINKYLPIQVDEKDPLPKTVCHSCAKLIIKWHVFANRSLEVESLLKQRCRQQPTATNEQNSMNLNENNYEDAETYTYNAGTSVGTWSPFSDQHESYGDGCNEANNEKIAKSNDEIASDDEPLASLASRSTTRDLYQDFYNALKKFRDHFVNTHHGRCKYSDFSDTSDSDNEDREDMDLNDFDDLTESNMRKDRMDEETRVELSEVQTKVNGKVYYTCKICGKNLSSSHTYVFHKRIHTGERPCVCHVCGKQFRVPNGLQRHLTETHLKQRRYICLVCHKNFANSQNLKQHMRIHTGERPYVCSHCGKRFTQSGSLHVHLKTHTEIFPHTCTDCDAKFRLRSSLKRHRLKHTGERPHVCALCGKGFRQRHELGSHQLSHSDSRPHACAACGAAFRQRRALRHHARRLHPAHPAHPAHAPPYE